jgi:hypothetical protein
MPRKRKPAAKKKAPARKNPPRPAGAKAEKGKGGQPPKKKGGGGKHPHPKHPYSRPSWGLPWFEQDKKKKKKPAPKPAPKPPTGAAEGGSAEPLPPPVEALVEWRKQHPVTPPTYTGYNPGDLGGGPAQTAPGAPPKQNGAPLYGAPAAPAAPVDTSPKTVSWGQLLADYSAAVDAKYAGWQPGYSDGGAATPQMVAAMAVRPDINLETAQQMMRRLSGGFYTGGQA